MSLDLPRPQNAWINIVETVGSNNFSVIMEYGSERIGLIGRCLIISIFRSIEDIFNSSNHKCDFLFFFNLMFEDCLQAKYFVIFLSSITGLLIDYFTTCSFS